MTAGRRYDLVTLQRATAVQDGSGEEIMTWTTLASEWAGIYYGRGSERRQAAMEQGLQAANFQVPDNAATRSAHLKDRIVINETGVIWDVIGVSPDTPKRGSVEITATFTSEIVDLEAES